MEKGHNNSGFSLMEVLLAVGTLAIGMIFIGGTFLTGVYFSTIATERTIAAVAADEAFAKIKLYGNDDESWLSELSASDCNNFSELVTIDANEFAYPSEPNDIAGKQYFWSALCRRVGIRSDRLVQVTVFVSRKVGSSITLPVPVQVGVSGVADSYELTITESEKISWINDGYTIVENTTGQIYRVIKRYAEQPDTILLDRDWAGPSGSIIVWVVPPASGGRGPCIAVYQKVIRF